MESSAPFIVRQPHFVRIPFGAWLFVDLNEVPMHKLKHVWLDVTRVSVVYDMENEEIYKGEACCVEYDKDTKLFSPISADKMVALLTVRDG